MKINSFKKGALTALLGLSAFMASCGDSGMTCSEQADPSILDHGSSFHQYINDDAVRLTRDYIGKSFTTDGIAQVKLKSKIDGDTAHFTAVNDSSTTLKARFYGIDTPESTGSIQPWGKPASNFTGSMLQKANDNGTIVLSANQYVDGVPSYDSTGSRYISVIWINLDTPNADYSDLFCLNLYIVQEGYSYVKSLSEMPTYVDTFQKAEAQAKSFKLHLFSDCDDPLYNYGSYEDVSLLALKNEVVATLKDPNHENAYSNAKVRVQGTVAGFSNHTLYLTDWCYYDGYTKDDKVEPGVTGEYAGINIYTGMSTIPSKFTTKNAYIQVSGTAAVSENFGFQISGCTFPKVSYDENDAKVILTASNNVDEHKLHTFEYTSSELNAIVDNISDTEKMNTESLYCSVKVTTPVEIVGGYTSDDEMTLYAKDQNWRIYMPFQYKTSDGSTWREHAYFVGHTVNVTGVFNFHTTQSGNTYWQLCLSNSDDLTIVS